MHILTTGRQAVQDARRIGIGVCLLTKNPREPLPMFCQHSANSPSLVLQCSQLVSPPPSLCVQLLPSCVFWLLVVTGEVDGLCCRGDVTVEESLEAGTFHVGVM